MIGLYNQSVKYKRADFAARSIGIKPLDVND
jgi:hypothetical protein